MLILLLVLLLLCGGFNFVPGAWNGSGANANPFGLILFVVLLVVLLGYGSHVLL